MILQPIVENSIIHGLIPMDGVNKIKIDFFKNDNFLQCRVEDNGIGRNAAEAMREGYQKTHKSFATQIMKERINIFNYYNKNHLNFEIEDKYDDQGKASGTVVTLTIPLDFRTREK
jgi:sensor histidine kinase YesM